MFPNEMDGLNPSETDIRIFIPAPSFHLPATEMSIPNLEKIKNSFGQKKN